MKFINAAGGIKKIFTAQILLLISGCLSVPAWLILLLMETGFNAESLSSDAGALITLLCALGVGLVGAVLMLMGYIMNIIGVAKAAKDEDSFRTSLIAIIIALITMMVSFVFRSPALNNHAVATICSSVADIAELCVTLYIIQGIRNLADALGDQRMNEKGNRIFMVILISMLLQLMTKLLTLFFENSSLKIVPTVLGVIAGVFDLIQYVMFLIYLAKAKKMLKES